MAPTRVSGLCLSERHFADVRDPVARISVEEVAAQTTVDKVTVITVDSVDDQNNQIGFRLIPCGGHGTGSEATAPNRADKGQNPTSPWGKIFRLDPLTVTNLEYRRATMSLRPRTSNCMRLGFAALGGPRPTASISGER
jgi:hypothetical protein